MITVNNPHGRLQSTLLAYAELVRLPNLFTSMADVVMGFLFTHAVFTSHDGLVLGLLVTASSSLYAAGTVLNDVFDFDQDAVERPDRPLPSGRLSGKTAGRLGGGLLGLGVAISWGASAAGGSFFPGLVGSLLAGCVVLYDGLLKRTPLGPVAMGGCRMLNVLLGMSAAAGPWQGEHWLAAAAVGTYIAGVTWFARTEARTSSRVSLGLAGMLILSGIGLLALLPRMVPVENLTVLLRQQPDRWNLLMLVVAAMIGFRGARAVIEPLPTRVQMFVRQCILTLVLLDAAACFVVRGIVGAVAVLVFLIPALVLGQWIRST
jgi:4-hydroxybenzoate polyprenyltransferase